MIIEINSREVKQDKIILSCKGSFESVESAVKDIISLIINNRNKRGLSVDVSLRAYKTKYSFIAGEDKMSEIKEYFLSNEKLKALGIKESIKRGKRL